VIMQFDAARGPGFVSPSVFLFQSDFANEFRRSGVAIHCTESCA
jgi:hypothetical protein